MLRFAASVYILSLTAAFADVSSFQTPSRNIQCTVDQEVNFADLECTIINRFNPPAQPRPSSCDADWGHTFFMRDSGPVTMLCDEGSSMTAGTAEETAEYGTTREFSGFVCGSSRSGLECINRDGHGFFLSRRDQRVF
ncbi:DUF6636 domain-containing protein [Litoreibacter roseus]|uniref:CVNH domain-containing protein n=1 Tax=Litoreibacter roseus TaxID=2601869 RepID=A0A6N6JKS2_9RHOB|nr:DUF6636 domain-containing protein [Litoreibacter roseus]GFE66645.1 hypothetical protein KIN_37190 [Litoreibacter roseus]